MNARQNSRYNMAAALISTCDAHEEDWADFDPFADAYADFKAAFPALTAAIGLQQGGTEGGTTSKKTRRTAVSTDMRILVPALQLHGRLNGDTRMVAESATTERMHLNASAPAYHSHAMRVLEMAQAVNLQPTDDKLAAYGAPKTFLTALGLKIADFGKAIGEPRHQKSESKRGTKDLDTAFDVLDEILEERMDPAAAVLGATTAPAFYDEYVSSRELVDPGYNVRELTVNIYDVQTNEPLTGVACTILPGPIQKLTGAGGSFYIDDLDGGVSRLEMSKPGYITKTVDFTIVDGQATVVEEKLVPVGGGAGD